MKSWFFKNRIQEGSLLIGKISSFFKHKTKFAKLRCLISFLILDSKKETQSGRGNDEK